MGHALKDTDGQHVFCTHCHVELQHSPCQMRRKMKCICLEQHVLPLNNSMAEVSLAQETPRRKELNAAHAESVQREKHIMKLTVSIVT